LTGDTKSAESLLIINPGDELQSYAGSGGINLLMSVAIGGHADIVKLLRNHASGAEQAKVFLDDGWNALMLAAQNNYAAAAKSLFEHVSGKAQAEAANSRG